MNNQKLENLLNLALVSSAEEKKNSQALDSGYTPETRTWELIIKYNGPIERLNSDAIRITPLLNGYAIVTIRSDLIEPFAQLDEVEYIEIPKRLYFE